MPDNSADYGPENPHPLSTRKTELIWEGKYDEYGNRREVDIAGCAMPMQKIETIDEPASRLKPLGLFDSEKAHKDDFRNMLIWKVVDIKLKKFVPSLAEVPSKELEALNERAIKSGFDFIDFWAVDFDYQDGQPFEHHWQAYRTRKDRSLPTVSNHEYDKYPNKGKHTACVKVVDIFGCDTSITMEVEI